VPERACCSITSLLQKRVVKVNFCLFCAKNVLGLGVEFFPLFQDGFLVVIVVDGIGPKLCFQAKTATLGVDCLAQVSAQKVSAVKLYARHVGVAIQRDARFVGVGMCAMASVQAKVVVVATAVLQLDMVCINVLPNGLWSAEIKWCARHVCLRLRYQSLVNFQVRVRKNLQNVVQNATILLAVQVEVGVVCWIEQSGAVTLAKVLDTKSFANNAVFYAVVHLVWIALVKVFACCVHCDAVFAYCHVVHLFVEAIKSAMQVVWPIVAIK
jgi:hypothetical protein